MVGLFAAGFVHPFVHYRYYAGLGRTDSQLGQLRQVVIGLDDKLKIISISTR